MEGYKNVLTDGLPDEDGSYLMILKGEISTPRLFVLYKQPDGTRLLVSVDGTKIQDDQISMYKRILITPDQRPLR
jgi:hypothetical protein